MPIPIRETFATDRADLTAQVTDDGSVTLIRTGTEDAFHSGCGAASETRHVYVQNSGVAARLQHGRSAGVLEVGLGTSMAMLMTFDWAKRCDAALSYVAFEPDWIAASTLEYLRPRDWVDDPAVVESYLSFRRSLPQQPPPGTYRWRLDEHCQATIHVGDVLRAAWQPDQDFDAIYYDPFCPQSAPELWTAEAFALMRAVITAEGCLSTYSCSRQVRDALSAAGWRPHRVAGPIGGKREVLVARPV
jgi:tRNA U34 5-methylaminomethyl-2-thiouridine-forming methyltransferase MnmC